MGNFCRDQTNMMKRNQDLESMKRMYLIIIIKRAGSINGTVEDSSAIWTFFIQEVIVDG